MLSHYAKAHQYLGEREKAYRIVEQAFDVINAGDVSAPPHADALFVRAALHAEQTHYTDAIAEQKAVIQLYPEYTNNRIIRTEIPTLLILTSR